jgi:UPF0755 protein
MYIKKILLAIALLGLVVLGYFSYQIYTAIFSPNTDFPTDSKAVYVPTNANFDSIRKQLKPELKNWDNFVDVAERKSYIRNLKAGHFVIEKGMNNNEIVNTLRSKNTPIYVIFNNQNRFENLAGRVSEQIEADSLSLLKTLRDTSFYSKNAIDFEDALAMYVPNKYEFYWNTSAKDFRERMLKEYKRFWNDNRLKKAEEIGLSKEQVSVLASIVKAETAEVEERDRVAGVYMNRLKKGWKLQADPTVIYALKNKLKNRDTIIRRVLYKDLEIKSPYNTYQNVGLPPGPIAMPDISAIEAVLNYEKHDYFYFVGDIKRPGYHKFAKTLRQHNINKQEYQRWINKQGIMR